MNQRVSQKTGFWILGLLAVLLLFGLLITKRIGSISVPPVAPSEEIASGEEVPFLQVPPGFHIAIFADDVPSARVMAFDPLGRMLVSQTKEGSITLLDDADRDGIAERRHVVVSGLKDPHGLAFRCSETTSPLCYLYVATHDALLVYDYDINTGNVGEASHLLDLPSSFTDRHTTRTLLFLPSPREDTLLISVGSSCDVCIEKDERYGSIIAYDIRTGESSVYAKGLRNAVFLTLHPAKDVIFMTEMGRDGLGDNIPPDEINVYDIAAHDPDRPLDFGWPICYGKNIHDQRFDTAVYVKDPCTEPDRQESWADIPAHSAPLGLAFVPDEGWPPEYAMDILISYHGSWNRSVPTGYKIVRAVLDEKGVLLEFEDFVTGWLSPKGEKLGRPVDIKVLPSGAAYISDDMRGVIYKIISPGG